MPRPLDALVTRRILDVVTQPVRELLPVYLAGCQSQHDLLLFIDGGVDFSAIQEKERGHRRVPGSLVTVHEGVSLNDRET